MCSEKINSAHNYPWLWLLGTLAWFWMVCYFFLWQQSLWTDEATQLKGLSLGPKDVVLWLLGENFDLGVPLDRMPPLSYWYGQAWSALFGLSVSSMRFASLGLSSLALVLFFHTVYRAFGKQSAILSGLLFATSPNLIVIAVEIRSYALFLLFCVGALWFVYQILKGKSGYLGLAACCLGALYSHFYGLVFSFSIFFALLITLWANNNSLRACLFAALGVMCGALGVLPFLLAAFGHPNAWTDRTPFWDGLRLIYRFLFHASMDQKLIVIMSALGACGLLICLIGTHFNLFRRVLCWTIGLGLLTVFIAALMTKAFEAASPVYNIWMLLPVFAILSSGLSAASPKLKLFATVSAVLILLAPLYGNYRLIFDGKVFSHGRYKEAFDRISAHRNVKILYDRSEDYGMPYFALYFLSEGNLPQYQVVWHSEKGVEMRQILRQGFGLPIPLDELSADTLVLIQVENQSNSRLREQLQSDPIPLEPKAVVKYLMASNQWRLKERKTLLAFSKIELFIFERTY